MMRKTISLIAILLTLFIGVSDAQVTNVRSGLVTLYGFDPLQSSLCFNDGGSGYVFENGKVVNRSSHLAFDIYEKDSLTAGIQGGERGYIIDLGTAVDLRQKYGYRETVGNGQGYASLHIADNNEVVILRNYDQQSYQSLKEAEALFEADRQAASAPVKLGHIYLVRIQRKQPEKDILAKVLVVAYRPGESVVLRWTAL